MIIEVLAILPDKTILVKQLDDSLQPEPGNKYTVWFEKIEPDPVPEFNT